MVVNIYTDASFNRQYSKAGYAFWIDAGGEPIKRGGPVLLPTCNSNIAEVRSITAALECFILMGSVATMAQLILSITKVIVYTDSRSAIDLISRNDENIKKYRLNTPEYKRAMLDFKNNVTLASNIMDVIEFRHVKAHKETNSTRSFINDWCDQRAKKELTMYIKKIRKNA